MRAKVIQAHGDIGTHEQLLMWILFIQRVSPYLRLPLYVIIIITVSFFSNPRTVFIIFVNFTLQHHICCTQHSTRYLLHSLIQISYKDTFTTSNLTIFPLHANKYNHCRKNNRSHRQRKPDVCNLHNILARHTTNYNSTTQLALSINQTEQATTPPLCGITGKLGGDVIYVGYTARCLYRITSALPQESTYHQSTVSVSRFGDADGGSWCAYDTYYFEMWSVPVLVLPWCA
jgi:hypothetical protein